MPCTTSSLSAAAFLRLSNSPNSPASVDSLLLRFLDLLQGIFCALVHGVKAERLFVIFLRFFNLSRLQIAIGQAVPKV